MTINETHFEADLPEILAELQHQLALNQIPLLQKSKDSGDDIMVQCPYHGNGQERRPSAGIRKKDGLLHCFRAGTKVLTDLGSQNIEDLVGTDSTILNGNNEWEKVKFLCYGESNLMKIVLSQDMQRKEIYATPEHEWFLHKNKYNTLPTELLKPGMILSSCISQNVDYTFDIDGFIHGVIYGDGCRHIQYVRHRVGGKRVCDKSLPKGCYYDINIPKFTKKAKLVEYFNLHDSWHVAEYNSRENYFTARSKVFDLKHNYKLPPSIDASHDYKMSFLSGYFATDGSIDLNSISCADFSSLNSVRDICISCNVSVRDIKAAVRTNSYVHGDHTLYILPILRESLPDRFYALESDLPKRKYCRSRWRVVSVEHTDLVENVYCCTTSTKSFVLDGNILTHNCFACGAIHPLHEVISHCFGHYEDLIGSFGYRWLCKNFATVAVEERKPIELNLSRRTKKKTTGMDRQSNENPYVTEQELDKYRYTHPYWAKRGITDERIIELFDLGYDPRMDCIVMPVRDIDGNCLFVARRSVKTKWFNYPRSVTKPLYGLYELSKFWKGEYNMNFEDEYGISHDIREIARPWVDEVIICESIIDALTAWQYGKYALAMNGLGTNLQFQQLRDLPCRKLILATDNDKAGMEARKRIRANVRNKIITEYLLPEGKKDLNDLTKEEFDNLQEVFS